MALPTSRNALPPSFVRRLARENRRMGLRLAQLEFREMQAELGNPALFDLRIDFPDGPKPATPQLPQVVDSASARQFAQLNVPLGKIAWADSPEDLPAIAIYCPDVDGAVIQSALGDLMKTHHAKAFARLIFVCASLRPIPFLGRYGFAYEYLGAQDIRPVGRRLRARYGIREVRDLCDGTVHWRP